MGCVDAGRWMVRDVGNLSRGTVVITVTVVRRWVVEVARQDACGRLKLVDYTCLYWGMFFRRKVAGSSGT